MILDIALSCLQDLRPIIPADTHPMLAGLLQKCWQKDPALRPTFSEILDILNSIKEVCIFDGMSIKFLSSICVFLSFDFFFSFCAISRLFEVLDIRRDTQVDLIPGRDEAVDAAIFLFLKKKNLFRFSF